MSKALERAAESNNDGASDNATCLIREALFAVVTEYFPQEAGTLDGLWNWWLRNASAVKIDIRLPRGLAVLGKDRGDGVAPMLLLAFAALISEWPERQELPTHASVEAALRAGAPHLGLRGARLQRIVEVSTEKLCAVLKRLENPTRSPRFALAPPEVLWVEELKSGRKHPPRETALATYPGIAELADVALTVDEHGGRWRGASGWVPFDDLKRQETAAIWLVLRYAGESFGHREIEAVRWAGGEDKSGRRRFPSKAREILESLIGVEVLPRGKNERYRVPLEGWSWRWIRLFQDPVESRLLRQFRGPREPAK